MRAPEPSRPTAEEEAFQWASDFFHEDRFELTPEGSRAAMYDAEELIELYDERHKDLKLFNEEFARLHRIALSGEGPFAVVLLCSLAATLIERGEPLPVRLRLFTARFLRQDPIFEQTGKPGPKRGDLIPRDIIISEAIQQIVKTWGLPATRNEATDAASAASIVRDALAKGADVYLSEKAINKIWSETCQYLTIEDSPILKDSDD
jgi:hypothetical protein